MAVTLPAQDIRTNLSGLTIQGVVFDPYTAVTVSIAMDGQTFTPQVINGYFEQILSFTTEKSYAIVVTAANGAGAVSSIQRNIIYDITPPELTIATVKSPTNDLIQLISGTRESGATVDVVCTTATVGTIEYPLPTSWQVTLSNMQIGDNSVTAISTDATSNRAMVSATINVTTAASNLFSFAVFGNNGVTMSGGAYTDSYVGSSASHVAGQYRQGDVGTNSRQLCGIRLSGGAKIYGAGLVGVGGSPATVVCLAGGTSISGPTDALASVKQMTPKTDPGEGTGVGVLKLSGNTSKILTTGNYRYSSITLSGASKLTLSGQITLHVDGNFTLSGNSSLVITSGTVTIFANGNKIDISGGSIVNSTQDPANLVIYGSSGLQTVNLSGGTSLHGFIFAPAAAIKITGGQETYGAIVGNTVDLIGGTSVHYPEDLSK